MGARRVYYFAPHGIFSGDCMKNIQNSFVYEVITTNTVSEPKNICERVHIITVGKILAEVISLLHKNVSVKSLRENRSIEKY